MNGSHALARQFDDPTQQRDAAVLGMWAFLSTEVLFFGVLFAGYTVCRWRLPEAFAAGSRHTDLKMGAIETAVLLCSSCAAALALRDIQLGGRRAGTWLLALTAALGACFLVMHGFEYVDEYHEGLVPGLRYTQVGPLARKMEAFYYLYFAITGLHSLHVLIGVVLMLTMAVRNARGTFSSAYFTPVELSALYWHLVDIVWIFVYPLLYMVGRAS